MRTGKKSEDEEIYYSTPVRRSCRIIKTPIPYSPCSSLRTLLESETLVCEVKHSLSARILIRIGNFWSTRKNRKRTWSQKEEAFTWIVKEQTRGVHSYLYGEADTDDERSDPDYKYHKRKGKRKGKGKSKRKSRKRAKKRASAMMKLKSGKQIDDVMDSLSPDYYDIDYVVDEILDIRAEEMDIGCLIKWNTDGSVNWESLSLCHCEELVDAYWQTRIASCTELRTPHTHRSCSEWTMEHEKFMNICYALGKKLKADKTVTVEKSHIPYLKILDIRRNEHDLFFLVVYAPAGRNILHWASRDEMNSGDVGMILKFVRQSIHRLCAVHAPFIHNCLEIFHDVPETMNALYTVLDILYPFIFRNLPPDFPFCDPTEREGEEEIIEYNYSIESPSDDDDCGDTPNGYLARNLLYFPQCRLYSLFSSTKLSHVALFNRVIYIDSNDMMLAMKSVAAFPSVYSKLQGCDINFSDNMVRLFFKAKVTLDIPMSSSCSIPSEQDIRICLDSCIDQDHLMLEDVEESENTGITEAIELSDDLMETENTDQLEIAPQATLDSVTGKELEPEQSTSNAVQAIVSSSMLCDESSDEDESDALVIAEEEEREDEPMSSGETNKENQMEPSDSAFKVINGQTFITDSIVLNTTDIIGHLCGVKRTWQQKHQRFAVYDLSSYPPSGVFDFLRGRKRYRKGHDLSIPTPPKRRVVCLINDEDDFEVREKNKLAAVFETAIRAGATIKEIGLAVEFFNNQAKKLEEVVTCKSFKRNFDSITKQSKLLKPKSALQAPSCSASAHNEPGTSTNSQSTSEACNSCKATTSCLDSNQVESFSSRSEESGRSTTSDANTPSILEKLNWEGSTELQSTSSKISIVPPIMRKEETMTSLMPAHRKDNDGTSESMKDVSTSRNQENRSTSNLRQQDTLGSSHKSGRSAKLNFTVREILDISSDEESEVHSASNVKQQENLPKNMSSDLPMNMSMNLPKNMLFNMPKSMPQDVPKNMPVNMPTNRPTNMPKDMMNDMPKQMRLEDPIALSNFLRQQKPYSSYHFNPGKPNLATFVDPGSALKPPTAKPTQRKRSTRSPDMTIRHGPLHITVPEKQCHPLYTVSNSPIAPEMPVSNRPEPPLFHVHNRSSPDQANPFIQQQQQRADMPFASKLFQMSNEQARRERDAATKQLFVNVDELADRSVENAMRYGTAGLHSPSSELPSMSAASSPRSTNRIDALRAMIAARPIQVPPNPFFHGPAGQVNLMNFHQPANPQLPMGDRIPCRQPHAPVFNEPIPPLPIRKSRTRAPRKAPCRPVLAARSVPNRRRGHAARSCPPHPPLPTTPQLLLSPAFSPQSLPLHVTQAIYRSARELEAAYKVGLADSDSPTMTREEALEILRFHQDAINSSHVGIIPEPRNPDSIFADFLLSPVMTSHAFDNIAAHTILLPNLVIPPRAVTPPPQPLLPLDSPGAFPQMNIPLLQSPFFVGNNLANIMNPLINFIMSNPDIQNLSQFSFPANPTNQQE